MKSRVHRIFLQVKILQQWFLALMEDFKVSKEISYLLAYLIFRTNPRQGSYYSPTCLCLPLPTPLLLFVYLLPPTPPPPPPRENFAYQSYVRACKSRRAGIHSQTAVCSYFFTLCCLLGCVITRTPDSSIETESSISNIKNCIIPCVLSKNFQKIKM